MKKKKIFHLPINNLEVSRETIRKYELFHISSEDIYELPFEFPAGNFLDTGTLRNSFFTNPLIESKYTGELSLYLDIYGSCKVLIYYQSSEGSVHLLKEESYKNEDNVQKIPLQGSIKTPQDVLRYFYTIESNGLIINNIYYAADLYVTNLRHTNFLLRTYGNTDEVINSIYKLFKSKTWLNKQETFDLFKENTSFTVLDTSGNVEDAYIESLEDLNININVFSGPNLGGGGNAAINLLKAEEYNKDKTQKIDYVILDDDVQATSDTLYRTFAYNQLKKPDTTFGAPIFMASEPNRCWEMGGVWGREFKTSKIKFNSISPQLNLHGLKFGKYANLIEISKPQKVSYTTFNLFSFSEENLKKIGYPGAFFLRGDDIDYSLRMGRKGALEINPNLLVWQEPAHSYWQEYMAYMHGIILNIVHGYWDGIDALNALCERINDHAKINDLNGIILYSYILEDLFIETKIFEKGFEKIYLHRRKIFSEIEKDFIELGYLDESSLQVINFVHPNTNLDKNKQNIGLYWNTKKSFFIYEPDDKARIEEKMDLLNSFYNKINSVKPEIEKKIIAIKKKYGKTTEKQFWENIKLTYEIKQIVSKKYLKKKKTIAQTQKKENINSVYIEKKEKLGVIDSKKNNDFVSLTRSFFTKNNTTIKTKDEEKKAEEIISNTVKVDNKEKRNKREILAMTKKYFDKEKYYELNPDVKESGMDAWEHYKSFGIKEGRAIR